MTNMTNYRETLKAAAAISIIMIIPFVILQMPYFCLHAGI